MHFMMNFRHGLSLSSIYSVKVAFANAGYNRGQFLVAHHSRFYAQ